MSNLTPEAKNRIKDFMAKMNMGPGMSLNHAGPNYATVDDLTKVYVYMERTIMYLMVFLIKQHVLTKKEAIQVFISAMNDAGESNDKINESVKELKKIFQW